MSTKVILRAGRKASKLWLLPVAFAGAICADASASSFQSGSEELLKFLNHVSGNMDRQLASLSIRSEECVDNSDRRKIETYLQGTRDDYLKGPLNDALSKNMGNIDSYVNGIEDLLGSRRGMSSTDRVRFNKMIEDGVDVSNREFQRLSEIDESAEMAKCLQQSINVSRLKDARSDLRTAFSRIQSDMALDYRFANASATRNKLWINSEKSSTEQALSKFDLNLENEVKSCCPSGQSCSASLRKAQELDGKLASAFNGNSFDYKTPPNPLEIDELSCADAVEIIKEQNRTLKKLRTNDDVARSEDDKYYDEHDVFESMAQCRIKARRYQGRSAPMKNQVLGMVGGLAKCTLAPMWGSGKKTSTQQLTSAIAGMDIPGLECDPGTQEMWDAINAQGRDLNNWGIQGLENADHLVALRSIPPIDTGLAVPGLTASEYLLMTPSPGIDNIANIQGAGGRTTGNPINAGVGPQMRTAISSEGSSGRAPASVGATVASTASTNSGSNVSRNTISSSSGYSLIKRASNAVNVATQSAVSRGQNLVQGVRTASSNIRKGVDARISSLKLKDSSAKIASTLSTGVSRSMLSSSSNRRSSRSQVASDVRRTTLRTLGSSASRAVGEGILDSLRNTGGNSVDDIGQQRRDVETAVTSQIQKHLNNIEVARVKGEEAREEIMRITNEHALAIAEARIEADGQPTAVIAEVMRKLHHKIADITTRAGVKRAAYDTAQAAIYAEQSAMQRLMTFGPQNLNVSIPGGDGGRGSTNTNSAGDTYRSITNTGAMPDGLPADGRGNLSWLEQQREQSVFAQIWKMVNPIQDAWASTVGDEDAFFMKEWKRFMAGMESYVEDRRLARDRYRREAANHVVRNNTRNSEENFSRINSNALLSMDMYLNELESEVEFILAEEERKKLAMTVSVKNNVVAAAANAREARQAWNQAQRANFEDLSENPEEYPEVWLSFLPEIILN